MAAYQRILIINKANVVPKVRVKKKRWILNEKAPIYFDRYTTV